MTVGQSIRHAVLRTVSILLAAGSAVAATYAMTPPYDQIREEAAEAEQAKKQPPPPGSEEALRRVIDEIQRGQPDYARMDERLSDIVRRLMVYTPPLLEKLGPLQSVAYAGGSSDHSGFYRATYVNGSVRWAFSMGKRGMIEGLGFGPISPSNPQQWVDSYAAFPMGAGATEMAVRFAEFLALVAFGRVALRIRL
jgi:hypothetical protein